MSQTHPVRQITLFDSICLIVGIMIGTGIFESAPGVAQNTTGIWPLAGVWIVGGVLSLLGALTYAGLAQKYPQTGGDYVYLDHAFGRKISFLYAWCMLTVVRPGNLGAMAYVFARYAQQICPIGEHGMFIYACFCILLLSVTNLLGTREGKAIQNVLTVGKVLGICFLVLVGWFTAPTVSAAVVPQSPPSLALAMIFVLFAYGGWNEIAFVAAEVKDPQRNLYRSLVGGTAAVTLLYLVVNSTFLYSVGFEGLRQSDAVAHTIASRGLSGAGGIFVSALIALSAMGTINGMIFSGARIYYAMGQDHKLFAPLGTWSKRGTPFWSIFAESFITLALMALFSQSQSGFESFILYTTPLFYAFLALVAICAFKLLPAGSRLRGHTWSASLFLLTCLFMLAMSLQYAYENVSREILFSLAILALGFVIERFEAWRAKTK